MNFSEFIKANKISDSEALENYLDFTGDLVNGNIYTEQQEIDRMIEFLCALCDPEQESRNIALLHELGVPQENALAMLGVAHCNLGSMYYTGTFLPLDYMKAKVHYESGYRFGEGQAACNLGYIYLYNRTGEYRPDKAFECFSFAASQDNINATYKLGDLYNQGLYVEKSPLRAFAMYRKAEDLIEDYNDTYWTADVYPRLAEFYAEGKVVDKDLAAAHSYYMSAADSAFERILSGDKNAEDIQKRCVDKAIEILPFLTGDEGLSPGTAMNGLNDTTQTEGD